MAYYVDTCDGRLIECDTLAEARDHIARAEEAARAFEAKMGFLPFWFKAAEIRKGRRVEGRYMFGEEWNQAVVAATKKVA
jgi:hypothetical protein